jgi:hypothetical protein
MGWCAAWRPATGSQVQRPRHGGGGRFRPVGRCDPGGARTFSRQRLSVDPQPAGPRSARRARRAPIRSQYARPPARAGYAARSAAVCHGCQARSGRGPTGPRAGPPPGARGPGERPAPVARGAAGSARVWACLGAPPGRSLGEDLSPLPPYRSYRWGCPQEVPPSRSTDMRLRRVAGASPLDPGVWGGAPVSVALAAAAASPGGFQRCSVRPGSLSKPQRCTVASQTARPAGRP